MHTVFDHTSLLRYLTDKWGLGKLGQRTPKANTFASVLQGRSQPRKDTLLRSSRGALLGPLELPAFEVNENQKALVLFSQVLEKGMADVEDIAAIVSRSLRLLNGPQAQFAVAKERFERYILYAKAGKLGESA